MGRIGAACTDRKGGCGSPGSPRAALEAVFKSNTEFICGHPRIPWMMLGEFLRAKLTLAKLMAQGILGPYREKLARLVKAARSAAELRHALDLDAVSTRFIGSIQGPVALSLLAGDVDLLRRNAPRTFDILLYGLVALLSTPRAVTRSATMRAKIEKPNLVGEP